MYFITGSDETCVCELICFKEDVKIDISRIYSVNGKVEKRFDKYQIIINKIKEVDYE